VNLFRGPLGPGGLTIGTRNAAYRVLQVRLVNATAATITATLSPGGTTALAQGVGASNFASSLGTALHAMVGAGETFGAVASAASLSMHLNAIDLGATTPTDQRGAVFYRGTVSTGSASTYQALYTVPAGYGAVITSLMKYNAAAGDVWAAISGVPFYAAVGQPAGSAASDAQPHVLGPGDTLSVATSTPAQIHATGVLFALAS
jgi:hypothetical protein